jgi:uncharacterized membrane protein YcjF (UPF0283 family)
MAERLHRLRALILIFGFCGSVFTPWAVAQTTAGTINGSVHDESGAPVPDADVAVTNQGTSSKAVTKSNVSGDFVVTGLAVGTYNVSVAKAGFQTFQVTSVFLGAAQTVTVGVALTIGQVTSEVTVAAGAQQVQLSTAEVSNIVSEEQIESLRCATHRRTIRVALPSAVRMPWMMPATCELSGLSYQRVAWR